MGRASIKSDLRHVRDTMSRFASIMAITALGVAIFSGIKATAPDMRQTAQEYYNQAHFMDFRLLSTVGFNDDDIAAIRGTAGVKSVMPAYSTDASVTVKETSFTVKLHSIDLDKLASGATDALNRPQIVEGRMPTAANECLADPRFMLLSGLHVGDKVVFASGTDKDIKDSLKQEPYTITGVARCPLYISYERGSSSIGSGAVNAYFLLPSSAFSIDVYTEVYLTADNPRGLSRFDGAYDDLLQPVDDGLVSVGKDRADIRYAEIRREGEDKLASARKDLADAEQQLADGQKKLEDARAKITDGEQKLNDARNEFNRKIADGQAKLDASEKQYKAGLVQWNKNSKALAASRKTYEANVQALEAAKAQVGLAGKSAAELAAIAQQLEAQLALLPPTSPQVAVLAAQLQAVKALLDNQQKLDAAAGQLKQGEKQLAAAKRKLNAAKTQLDAGKKSLLDAKVNGQKEIDSQQKKLNDAKKDLEQGEHDYEQQKKDAEPKMADARQSIADGQKQLDELKTPTWYVLDIDINPGFASFKADTERIAAIGVVFPLIFFLVAALVSLTTMTRLVEDERGHIGTLKALGYGRASIAAKYLLYAVAASAVGSAIGFLTGFNIFPRVIFHAYQILYTLPDVQPAFNPTYAVTSTAAAAACSALPAWAVCVQSLRASPASLMLPKAPLPGKRIFLERIRFLWKRLKFTQKVTARNLFLYKKRLLMTIAGVAGCTALILTGFGIMDSISSIVEKQYGQIRTFDVSLDLKDTASADELAALDRELVSSGVLGSVHLHQQSVDVLTGQAVKSVYLVVPKQTDAFPRFVHLHTRATGAPLALNDSTVIVSEKLSILYHWKVGDSFTIRDGDGVQKKVTIGGIAENYVYHYVYMSPALYETLFGKAAEPNQVLCTVDKANADAVCQRLLDQKAVLALTQIAKLEENFRKMVGALKYVVVVLIVSAALLAFVVLFSLTNINIDERARELATIKVLGFYTREMAGYIFRENIVLTFIGTACGLALGVLLERFVIVTAEVDLVMFGRAISWGSFAWSALLTFLFAAFVNAVMTFRLKKIDMTSTLKSNE